MKHRNSRHESVEQCRLEESATTNCWLWTLIGATAPAWSLVLIAIFFSTPSCNLLEDNAAAPSPRVATRNDDECATITVINAHRFQLLAGDLRWSLELTVELSGPNRETVCRIADELYRILLFGDASKLISAKQHTGETMRVVDPILPEGADIDPMYLRHDRVSEDQNGRCSATVELGVQFAEIPRDGLTIQIDPNGLEACKHPQLKPIDCISSQPVTLQMPTPTPTDPHPPTNGAGVGARP